jgi:hypothetical protein
MPKQIQIAVAYNPEYAWEPIAVAPDHAFIDTRDKLDEVVWSLVSSDPEAEIQDIVFAEQLFHEVKRDPTNEKNWLGVKPFKNKDGGFKYTIKVGNPKASHELDPVLVAGRRP